MIAPLPGVGKSVHARSELAAPVICDTSESRPTPCRCNLQDDVGSLCRRPDARASIGRRRNLRCLRSVLSLAQPRRIG
jgi:hypothetical protein